MANTFYLKKGDTNPKIEAVLSDSLGPVDLTGATVTIRMSIEGGTDTLLEETATIQSPATDGGVEYQWQTGDTDTIGTHIVEWKVVFADSSISTFPRGDSPIFNEVVIQKVVD